MMKHLLAILYAIAAFAVTPASAATVIYIDSYRFGEPASPPPGVDPYFANVVLLLHCDGTDGSTTFTDSSGSAHSITVNGDAQIDTAEKKFGTGAFLSDGVGDFLQIANDTDFDFGTGDWTIEWWANWSRTDLFQTFWTYGYTSGGGLLIQSNGSGRWRVLVSGSAIITETSATPSTGTWYHYAVVKDSGTITLYRDGVAAGSASSAVSLSASIDAYIGNRGQVVERGFYGSLDEIRVTIGVARDVTVVPTAAFPDS